VARFPGIESPALIDYRRKTGTKAGNGVHEAGLCAQLHGSLHAIQQAWGASLVDVDQLEQEI
jgi:hypothetical protein